MFKNLIKIGLSLLIGLLFCKNSVQETNTIQKNKINCNIKQIHINQGIDPLQMIISWSTDYDETLCPSIVSISDKTNPSTNQLVKPINYSGEIITYSITNTLFDDYQSKYIHHVMIDSLMSDNLYSYQIATDTNIYNFKTLPNSYPLNFGVIGDLGQTSYSADTIKHLNADKQIKMILHAGDLSYADCDQKLWDSYGELIEPLANHIPWMVCAGNHEIEYYNNNTPLYYAFESRYRMQYNNKAEFGDVTIPSAINPSTKQPYCTPSIFQSVYNYGNSFYSFNAGPAHIIYLNPYAETDINSVQYKWLENDLGSINNMRKQHPWIIVVMHCPWYNSNYKHYADEQTVLMRESMEPLFFKYNINLVISGHVHAYERTYPVYANQTMKYGTTYISIGNGGNIEGLDNNYYPQPSWSAFRNGTQYGHGKLTLLNDKQMVWRWYRNVDGQLIFKDEVIINNFE